MKPIISKPNDKQRMGGMTSFFRRSSDAMPSLGTNGIADTSNPMGGTATEAPLLEITGLHVESHGVALLRDITLKLARGRTLGLVGESGAGKSMLGRVLARDLPRGFTTRATRLQFSGHDMLSATPSAHRALLGKRIAFIPQEPMSALDPTMPVGKQCALHLARLGVPAAARRQRTIDALNEVLLPHPETLLAQFPFQLSGGMCQRIAIAMAFASNPDLVISDEATTALDVTTQRHIVELMRSMQSKRGTSVLFVTHDLGLALHACDDIAVLYAGELMESGSAHDVVYTPRHPYTQALLRANPPLVGPRVRVTALDGHMPGFEALAGIAGCRFASRCARAELRCHHAPVALQTLLPIQPASSPSEDKRERAARVPMRQSVRCLFADAPLPSPPREPLNTAIALSDKPFLTLQGIAKRYPLRANRFGFGNGHASNTDRSKATAFTALAPMDLTIAPGEFIGIVGESGSGKSTLAKLVMGLDTPSEGVMLLDGQPLDGGVNMNNAGWRRRIDAIQMIFQDARAALNPRRRLGNIVTQSMENRHHLHVDRARRASDLLDEIGLSTDMAHRYPSQLSGGQRQRINIARALCDVPRLLVADEIVSGLDVSVQAQIMTLLLRLRESHKIALLLISHDLAVVRYLCSRIVVMQHGVVVESGPTQAVLSNPQHPYTRSLMASAPHISPLAPIVPTPVTSAEAAPRSAPPIDNDTVLRSPI